MNTYKPKKSFKLYFTNNKNSEEPISFLEGLNKVKKEERVFIKTFI